VQAFEPLRIAGFRRLWIASLFFGTANSMQIVASNWLMLQLTGSPLWVGLMVATPTLPLLLIALPSGALADIVERRRVLILSTTLLGASAFGMAGLFIIGALTPSRLLALGVLAGVGLALYVPAWQATISDLVPREVLARAIALNSASGAVAMALGPLLGGLAMARYSFAVPATAATIGYSILLIGLLQIPRFQQESSADSSIRTAISIGLRHVRHSPGYRRVLLVAAAFGAGSAALRAVMPSVVEDQLLAGPGTYGVVLGAMGVGALAGALLRERASLLLRGRLVPGAIAAYAGMEMAVALSRSLTVSIIAMLVAGFAWTATLSTIQAEFQLLAPDWVRARALSIYNVALLGMITVGTILTGMLASVMAPTSALMINSVGLLLLSIFILRGAPIQGGAIDGVEPIGTRPLEGHPDIESDQRVLVSTVWTIDRDQVFEFVAVMDELRRVRLRTGAFRWTLYRDVVRPLEFTEVFEVRTWEQHLQQHRHLDARAIAVIAEAIAFDVSGRPRSVHLVGVDEKGLRNPSWSSAQSSAHIEMHRVDGSIDLSVDDDVHAEPDEDRPTNGLVIRLSGEAAPLARLHDGDPELPAPSL
jgi:predicted MFS family arabinose efflux permease